MSPSSHYEQQQEIAEEMVLIGEGARWDGPSQGGCQICGGKPRNNHYCLACDRWGKDGTVKLPGLPKGEYLDPEYQD